jgi:hypothetical protein
MITTQRPICGWCGKPYGQRATTTACIVWREGEPRASYRGNGIVLKTSEHGPTRLLEETLGRPKTDQDCYAFLRVWDGQTWWRPYEPFCTLRCALDYARRAFRRYGDKV